MVDAGLLQLDMAADHLDHVHARQQLLDKTWWDHNGSLGHCPGARLGATQKLRQKKQQGSRGRPVVWQSNMKRAIA
ncbi:hypothetical protein GCM10009107_29710 [Ideonella azotifigens]|uniref:Uncharacterized protein n=1 Tax=Ideonella azotifigens TaxID=513160 RepID=A0ABP3VFX3_9BURK